MAEPSAKLDFDRRKSERAEVNEVAFISVAGSSTRCQIVNVSSDGAAVDVPDAAYIPDRFRLMTERDRVVRNWSYRRKLVTSGIGKAAYRGGA